MKWSDVRWNWAVGSLNCLYGCSVHHILSYSFGSILYECTYGCMFCVFLFHFVNYIFLLLSFCVLIVMYNQFRVFCVLFVCTCVLYYCHRVSTELQLTNISYHIIYNISYHIHHTIFILLYLLACSITLYLVILHAIYIEFTVVIFTLIFYSGYSFYRDFY